MTPSNDTALLLMDLQKVIVERFGGSAELLAGVQSAIRTARRADVPVIYVRLVFRNGYPEVDDNNPIFRGIKESGRFNENDEDVVFPDEIAPGPDDIVVTKKRISAFAGSDLAYVLASLGVRELVMGGVATSGVVLSTLRQASDLDFRAVVLRDACGDLDAEVHRVLLDRVFPRQAEVMTTAEWAARRAP